MGRIGNVVKNGKKKCNTCGKVKAISKFYKVISWLDTLRGSCKECSNTPEKQRKSREYYHKVYKKL